MKWGKHEKSVDAVRTIYGNFELYDKFICK